MITEQVVLNVLRNSTAVAIALDLEGNVFFWNRSAELLFGYKEEEVIGKFLPIIKNKNGFEFETIIEATKNYESLNFRSQKEDKNGNELDLVINTNSIYEDNLVTGVLLIIQKAECLKKIGYLPVGEVQKDCEPKRTFVTIRDLILLTLDDGKKTINQIATESGINWRTVEKHLTYLIGKKLVAEIFSSEFVRIFELTSMGYEYKEELKSQQYEKYVRDAE